MFFLEKIFFSNCRFFYNFTKKLKIMSKKQINEYYKNLEKDQRFGGTRNEISIKRPFINLLENILRTKICIQLMNYL